MPPGHMAMDISLVSRNTGIHGTLDSTSPLTYYTGHDTHRSVHNTDGKCGTRYCNGYVPEAYGVSEGQFNNKNKSHRRSYSCYRDTDCQFYTRDSSGLLSGEVVGTCVRRSDTLSMCECELPYFGDNCEYKFCPVTRAGRIHYRSLPGHNMDEAGDSGGGSSESQISAPLVGGVLGVGRRSPGGGQTNLDTNRGSNSEEGFECGGRRGDCQYETGKCLCHNGFHGAACEFRVISNGCSTTGATTRDCRAADAARHHSTSVGSLLQPLRTKHNGACADITNGACSGLADQDRYKLSNIPPELSLTQSTWGPVNQMHNRAGHAGVTPGHSGRNEGALDNFFMQDDTNGTSATRDLTVPHETYTADPNGYPTNSYT